MADLSGVRSNIQTEETDFKSAVSESMFKKVGKSINFINTRQYLTYLYGQYGSYGVVLTSLGSFPSSTYADIYVAPFDIEVMGLRLQSGIVGSSGNTTIDIHLLTANGATDSGTVFFFLFSVASTATSNLYGGFVYDSVSASTVTFGTTPTGFTLGTFSSLPFNVDQGDALRFDIDSVMGGDPRDISLTLYFRPR